MNALQVAVDNNQDKIINLFLSTKLCNSSRKIDLNTRSVEAVIKNEIEIFEKTLLFMSIEKRNLNTIKLLLARTDINVNEQSFHIQGNNPIEVKTALHLAAEKNDIEIIKLLLERKDIDINIIDGQGKKPIDYSSNFEIRQLLS